MSLNYRVNSSPTNVAQFYTGLIPLHAVAGQSLNNLRLPDRVAWLRVNLHAEPLSGVTEHASPS